MVAKIKASQIPEAVLREIKGLPKRKSEKKTSWEDVPPSWTKHEDCGYAGTGPCPYCDERDGIMFVQLDDKYHGHPKTLQLLALLGPEADTYPLRLWTWALQYAKHGVMESGFMIETACRWKGEPGKLVEALVKARFLESDGLTIHDWMDHTGHGIELYEQKKAKMRERRRSGDVPETFRKNSPQFPLEERRGPDLTVPDLTGEEGEPGSVLHHLMRLGKAAKIAGRLSTLRSYIESWLARSSGGKVEQILMDPWTRGKTVIEVQDHFFGKDAGDGKSWKDLIGGNS